MQSISISWNNEIYGTGHDNQIPRYDMKFLSLTTVNKNVPVDPLTRMYQQILSHRVLKSTLSAETLAVVECAEAATCITKNLK